MLSTVIAHTGLPPAPHDVLGLAGFHFGTIATLAVITIGYWRVVHPGSGNGAGSATLFLLGTTATAVAIASPLDGMAQALASAHMAQHIVLILVAAPLLAIARPITHLFHSAPRKARKTLGRWRRETGLLPARLAFLTGPIFAWLLLAGSVWFWHAAGPYELAIHNELVHVAEHACFLVAAMLFWRNVLSPDHFGPGRGTRVMMTFTMAFQGVILAALMTFARTPWYHVYNESTALWGLDPLTDQQLAGLIMWIPSGLAYTAVGIALVVSWLSDADSPAKRPARVD